MNRRGFLSALLAPIVARFAPRVATQPEPLGVSIRFIRGMDRVDVMYGFAERGVKIGETIHLRKPLRYRVDSAAHSSLESMMDAGAANETSWNEAQETAVL